MEEKKTQQKGQRKTPKPYKELLGPSTYQMKLEGKIKRKDHHTDSKDNGRVAFGVKSWSSKYQMEVHVWKDIKVDHL